MLVNKYKHTLYYKRNNIPISNFIIILLLLSSIPRVCYFGVLHRIYVELDCYQNENDENEDLRPRFLAFLAKSTTRVPGLSPKHSTWKIASEYVHIVEPINFWLEVV